MPPFTVPSNQTTPDNSLKDGPKDSDQKDSGNRDSRQIIRGTSVVAALTLVSRGFGFIRDLLIASLFGASAIADCFFIAFRIPNLLRSFVAEGALSSAFVPIFAGQLKSGREKAQQVISLVLGFLTVATVILSLLGIVFAEEILNLIAPGYMQGENALLCIKLTRIMMPYIVCVSLVAMLNGALNSVNVFGVAALAQVLMNICLICGALLAGQFNEVDGVLILSYSVVVGGVIQVLIQIPALAKAGFSFRPNLRLKSPIIFELVKLMLPAVVGATVYQLSQFLNILLASLLVTGSVSWLFYADRLTQLPIGVFSVALGSVLLPMLALSRTEGNHTGYYKHLIDSLRYTSFFIIPLGGVIFYFADPLIALLFERGEFAASDTANTALAVKAYAVGLWTVSCHSMLARAFIARKDTLTPTLVGVVTLAFTLVLSLLWMGRLSGAPDAGSAVFISALQRSVYISFLAMDLGHAGLALASSASSLIGFVVLALIFAVKNRQLDWRPFIRAGWKSAIAIIASIYLTSNLESGLLFLDLAICTALFFAIMMILRAKELLEIFSLLKRRLNAA